MPVSRFAAIRTRSGCPHGASDADQASLAGARARASPRPGRRQRRGGRPPHARMARINSAYDLLRDPVRRAAMRQLAGGTPRGSRRRRVAPLRSGRRLPEPTARPDRRRRREPRRSPLASTLPPRSGCATRDSARRGSEMRGHPPRSRRAFATENDLRASTPTGPVQTKRGARPEPLPTLQRGSRDDARVRPLSTATRWARWSCSSPTYLDWVSRTITRDRELVTKARVILADLEERGVNRRIRTGGAPVSMTRAAAG